MRSELIGLREKAGMSQADLGAVLGISQQAVNKFERYDSDPKLSTVRRYANAVGAIIEHHVTPDVGQSAIAASTSPWESVATITRGSSGSPKADRPQVEGSEWFDLTNAADSKRTDFALAG